MKAGQKLWTRDELILTMNLYWRIEFGKYHKGHPEVKRLAELIGRTPSAVALKLGNLASFDPSLKERGIKGASNASKLDREIWNEFYENPDILPYESEKLRAKFEGKTIEELNEIDLNSLPKLGKEREAIVKIRVNQNLFRQAVLQSYSGACCISGISNTELLIAGHIIPWAMDEKQRLNPRNGLLMNSLHDKAYENGLITIRPDYVILVSSELKSDEQVWSRDYFAKYDGQKIRTPNRFSPQPEFLEQHYQERFRK
ncbi:HNH endonuclease [Owenweeksia hongkongensis]|uniref:HNH endonuclease n=1 Tax=Owenweeksia hongkongensis TaxID=253245 RepID=UPI003A940D60